MRLLIAQIDDDDDDAAQRNICNGGFKVQRHTTQYIILGDGVKMIEPRAALDLLERPQFKF